MQRLSFLSRRALACASALWLGASGAAAATLPAGFIEQTYSGITNPTALMHAPDGRVFVSQQCGALRVIKAGQVLATPFATLPVSCSDERGLHSIAFDPNFASNGYVYVRFTRGSPTNNVIARLKASTSNPDVSDGTVTILFVAPFNGNRYHHGGGLVVGIDGKLYSSFGDHQSGSSAQSLSSLWGKVVRINIPDGSIPTDNPFYTTTTGDNRAIWAYGFRNPFTMAIQPVTGRIHVNDVGNSAGSCCEEVNHLTRGTNYDWPNSLGSNDYFGYTASSQGGNAIVGGTFYNPPNVNFPSSYVGRYFFGDYGGGWIRSIVGSGTPGSITGFASGISGTTDVETHQDGSMWYTARNSSNVRRICYQSCPPFGPIGPTPTPTPTTPPSLPPTCTITPGATTYAGGDQVCFTGDCNDPEDGPLPATAYHWESVFHHNTHIHPGSTFDDVKSICITLPVSGEWDPDQFWRVTLTGTDSGGRSGSASADIQPRKQPLTMASNPSGLQVAADGATGAGPFTVDAVVGMTRNLFAPAPQGTYHFASWSDGGARRHDVVMPSTATTYTANFKAASEYAEITPPGSAVTTSTSDTNVGANMVDNDLLTRWSGNGDGAWARFDLGEVKTVGHVRVAAYQGNVRRNRFDIQLSNDGVAWTTVISGETSGTTTNEETFDFADADARYVRYLGHGNVGSTNPTMNSVTEVSIFGGAACPTCPPPTPTPTPTAPPEVTPTPTPTQPIVDTEITPPASAVTASANDGNLPGNVVDGSLASRWSANGDGQWLQLDLGSAKTVSYLKVAFYNGNLRTTRFDVQCANGGAFADIRTGIVSSGTTLALETFDVPESTCTSVRYVGHGNSVNTWNSVTEVEIWQQAGLPPPPTPTPTAPPVTPTPTSMPATPTPTPTTPPTSGEITPPGSAFTASTSDTNVPANAGDNNLATRWSGNGDGAWLQADLGGSFMVTGVSTAAYNGTTRQNIFDIAVSADGTTWTTVLTGARTSGTTLNEEMFDVADRSARFVRYVGHMSTAGTFNSVTELSIFGTTCDTCPTPPPVTPTPTPTPTRAPNQVMITSSMTFDPASITIAAGATVTWVNQDSMSHTVTSDTGVWNSGEIPPGGSFSRTFTAGGSFAYHCSFHPSMTGTVNVSTAPFALKSSAFLDGAMMPVKYTCAFDGTAGIDISPPLNWGPGTMNAAAYAIVFADRVNGGNKLHWMIWDIKPEQLSLPEGLGAGYNVPNHTPAKQKAFTTGAATLQYFGPCPGGSTNPYTFTLYAQNVATIPGVTSSSTVTTIEAAIKANSKTTTAVLNVRSNAAR